MSKLNDLMKKYYEETKSGKLSKKEDEKVKKILEISDGMSIIETQNVYHTLDRTLRNVRESYYYDELSDTIENYFKGMATYEEVEDKVNSLPSIGGIVVSATTSEIDAKFRSLLYKFILYANFIGKTHLFKNSTVKIIISSEVKEDLEKYDNMIRLPRDLYLEIEKTKTSTDPDKYLDFELLKQIYAFKGNITVSDISKEIIKKKEEKAKIEGEVIVNKKAIRGKKFKRACQGLIFTSYIGLSLLVSGFLGFKGSKALIKGSNDLHEVHSVINDSKEVSMTVEKDTYLEKFSKYTEEEKRYVTVFSEIDNEEYVEVKVYDYTISKYTDEELKTMDLDQSRIVYSDKIKLYDAKKTVLGDYDDHAHRDIARIKYDFSKGIYIIFGGFSTLFIEALIMFGVLIITEFSSLDLVYDLYMGPRSKRRQFNREIKTLNINNNNKIKVLNQLKSELKELEKCQEKEKKEIEYVKSLTI